MHKAMCEACSGYEKQSIILDMSLSESGEKDVAMEDVEELKKLSVQRLTRANSPGKPSSA